jgi:hypothetical protein
MLGVVYDLMLINFAKSALAADRRARGGSFHQEGAR